MKKRVVAACLAAVLGIHHVVWVHRRLLSARDFEADVKRSEQAIREILKEQ